MPGERKVPKSLLLRLAACGLVCFAAAAQLLPAPGQQTRTTLPGAIVWRLTPEQAARLESDGARDPEDLTARTGLILHYLVVGMNEQRAGHALWMIEHHPEAEVHQVHTLFGEPGPLQDIPSYTRAAALWRQQAVARASDPGVVLNAAGFLELYFGSYLDDLFQGEQWVKRAREIEPDNKSWTSRLASYYWRSLRSVARGTGPWANPSFAEHARSELESSADGFLLWHVGYSLATLAAQQDPGLAELSEFGKRLLKRAGDLGYRPPDLSRFRELGEAADLRRQALFSPQPLKRTEPVYPRLAQQARIQGTVRLRVLIARNGGVQDLEPLSGHPLLVDAASAAVRQWVYGPQSMETLIEVELPFRLE